jgi:hypothetical protein
MYARVVKCVIEIVILNVQDYLWRITDEVQHSSVLACGRKLLLHITSCQDVSTR